MAGRFRNPGLPKRGVSDPYQVGRSCLPFGEHKNGHKRKLRRSRCLIMFSFFIPEECSTAFFAVRSIAENTKCIDVRSKVGGSEVSACASLILGTAFLVQLARKAISAMISVEHSRGFEASRYFFLTLQFWCS